MKLAEHVTFGGGGLDRAAHIRADNAALDAATVDPTARIVPLWRGKPAFKTNEDPVLVSVPFGHPVLKDMTDGPVFLGFAQGSPWFAADISGWEPDENPVDPTAFFDPTEQRHPALKQSGFRELRGAMAAIGALDAEIAATAKAILGWHSRHRFCAACGSRTQATMAGWQRSCPACKAQHFPRTDPVVIMLITMGNAVLIGRSPGWPDGMYSLLAGFVEPGETVEAAVRREVAEETGVRVGEVAYLASQPWPYPSSLMIGCAGTALSRDIRLDPQELDDAIWVTRERMLAAFAGQDSQIRPARKGSIAHFVLRNWLADRLD